MLQLFARGDQTLLVRWDALLVLDFGFDILNGVTGLDLKGDGLACQGLHKDLHLCVCCAAAWLKRKRYHNFLIHLSADGHLVLTVINSPSFHVLAIVNSAAMNIGVYVSPSIVVSLVCLPSSGIAGSYGSSSSSF